VYDEAALDLLRAIRVAKAAGFSVAELRILFRGFTKGAALSRMWKALAQRKLVELDAMIERATAMKDVLRSGLECDCLTLSDCRLLSNSGVRTRRDGR
jgi:MerR family redox-sensitive transcriptional activator SoxR